ncbi:MAG: diguanylate cyclase/phosphodiesterase with PAS/PAC sensor(s) [Gallionellaceae bacterium]|nr:MAG: diguanylate cyclase/phosphodiesterase with PAS/PAC sensor(s) [Gallionellaceae bacterium]
MSRKPNQPDALRAGAEARLARAPLAETCSRPAEELLHELQVHQIELEMQNETLRQAQIELEESRDRYRDLYDFAPVGYLTLTRAGLIEESNFTGAALLGVERGKLLQRRFAHFVAPESGDRWHQIFMRAVLGGERQDCELVLQRGGEEAFHAQLDLLPLEKAGAGMTVRIALTNTTARKRAEAQLRSSEERYRQIVQTSMDGFIIADRAGRLLDANAAYCRMIGYTRDELLNMQITDVEAKETPEETARHIREVMAQGAARFETRHRRKDGQVLEIEVSNVFRQDADGGCIFAFLRDISARKRAEEELRIAAIAFESNEGVTVTDASGVIVRVNRAFTRLTGYSAEEVVGRTPALLQSGRHDQDFYRQMWAALKQRGFWQGEMWNRRKNGKIYAEWLTISAVFGPDERVTHYVGTFSDITQNSEAEAEIHRLAYYDPLTLLPNRRMLQERLGQVLAAAARSGQKGAVLFLDLDNFKTLNDTRGHDIGDMLLTEVAQRIRASVREMDTVARLGGDEFVVILESLAADTGEATVQAGAVGEKLREILARPYDLDGREFYCTASIGISLFGEHGETVEELLKHADLAMYHSKTEGRNALHFFDPAMQAALDRRSALEGDLRQALARGELQLYYQPQVDGARRLIGAEALLRWAHPERGLVAPDEFIALAEETGLILPIGCWVLQTACAQIKTWEKDPRTRHLQLAVNVSARQFRQPDFVARVRQALAETGADPARLKIELTETLVLDDVADTIRKMTALRADGVGFSMDDFGTGYSSLTYLKQLPLDQLKIDRSFVRNLTADPNDAAIVQAIITMGKTFGLNVVAEGVETDAQHALLGLHGCHAFQGYLFGKPVTLPEFEELILQCA